MSVSQGRVIATAREASVLSFQPIAIRSHSSILESGGWISTSRPVPHGMASMARPTGERLAGPPYLRLLT